MKNQIAVTFLLLGLTLSAVAGSESLKVVDLQVTEDGFQPSEIKVSAGTHVLLSITRKTDVTCATQIVIQDKQIKQALPLNKTVKVDLGILKKGDIRFACGMDMISGHILAQ